MATWESAITQGGVALLSKWAAGGTMKISGAKAGTGFVREDLASQTALVEVKSSPSIINKRETDGGVEIKLQIQAAEEGYVVNQIGLFAQLDGGEETLISIYQNTTGVAVPSSEEMAEFAFEFYTTLKISNDGKMTAAYDPNAYLTHKSLLEVEERMERMLQRAATPLYTLTVPTEGWELDEAGDGRYWVTLPLESVKAGDSIAVDVVQLGQAEADELALEHWAMVRRAVVNDGSITLRATEAPESQYQIQLKVIL